MNGILQENKSSSDIFNRDIEHYLLMSHICIFHACLPQAGFHADCPVVMQRAADQAVTSWLTVSPCPVPVSKSGEFSSSEIITIFRTNLKLFKYRNIAIALSHVKWGMNKSCMSFCRNIVLCI